MPGRENRAARGSLAAVGPRALTFGRRFSTLCGRAPNAPCTCDGEGMRHSRVTCSPKPANRAALKTGERPRGLSAPKRSAMRSGPGIRLRPCSLSWREGRGTVRGSSGDSPRTPTAPSAPALRYDSVDPGIGGGGLFVLPRNRASLAPPVDGGFELTCSSSSDP